MGRELPGHILSAELQGRMQRKRLLPPGLAKAELEEQAALGRMLKAG